MSEKGESAGPGGPRRPNKTAQPYPSGGDTSNPKFGKFVEFDRNRRRFMAIMFAMLEGIRRSLRDE